MSKIVYVNWLKVKIIEPVGEAKFEELKPWNLMVKNQEKRY